MNHDEEGLRALATAIENIPEDDGFIFEAAFRDAVNQLHDPASEIPAHVRFLKLCDVLDLAFPKGDLLEQATVLSVIDHGSVRMHVMTFDGQDILVIGNGSDWSFVVYPPEAFDDESGGSIHDHARAILADAAAV